MYRAFVPIAASWLLVTSTGPVAAPKPSDAARAFNGVPAEQPHTRADYALTEGTPVLASAEGTVVLAEDLFYAGNAVIVDHRDGLFTMYFHLSEASVRNGESVGRGDRVGLVGSTGRATGPHLFFGVHRHGARIDPRFLLEDPAKIPSVESLKP